MRLWCDIHEDCIRDSDKKGDRTTLNPDCQRSHYLPQEIEALQKSHEALLEAAKTLMESTRHAYNCPELKNGGACNCGFHEAIVKGAAAIGQAKARP